MNLDVFNDITDDIHDGAIKEYYDNRTLILDNDITGDLLRDIILHILLWNKDDENIPVGKRHKIKIFIDSDGGSVFAANNLINVIECSETPIVGVAFSVAASAASSILVACDERYAFKHSTILLHDGSVMVQNSGNKARQTMDFLDKVDSVVKDTILKHTKITEEEYEANKKDEQFMFADEAKEKGIIDYIIGVDCTLNEIL